PIADRPPTSASQPPRPRDRRRYDARVAAIGTVKPLFQPKRIHPATRALTWVCSGVGSRRKRQALRTIMKPCYLWSTKNASDIRHASNGVRNLHAHAGCMARDWRRVYTTATLPPWATGGHQEEHALPLRWRRSQS